MFNFSGPSGAGVILEVDCASFPIGHQHIFLYYSAHSGPFAILASAPTADYPRRLTHLQVATVDTAPGAYPTYDLPQPLGLSIRHSLAVATRIKRLIQCTRDKVSTRLCMHIGFFLYLSTMQWTTKRQRLRMSPPFAQPIISTTTLADSAIKDTNSLVSSRCMIDHATSSRLLFIERDVTSILLRCRNTQQLNLSVPSACVGRRLTRSNQVRSQ